MAVPFRHSTDTPFSLTSRVVAAATLVVARCDGGKRGVAARVLPDNLAGDGDAAALGRPLVTPRRLLTTLYQSKTLFHLGLREIPSRPTTSRRPNFTNCQWLAGFAWFTRT